MSSDKERGSAAPGVADRIDEAAVESFPASDPPAWTPVAGEKAAPEATDAPPQSSAEPPAGSPSEAGSDGPGSGGQGTGGPGDEPRQALQQLEAEVADLRDRLLRAIAEQENIRRRATRDRDEAVRFAAADVARDLLPTLDNLRSALGSVQPDSPTPADQLLRNLLAGVEATERALLGALAGHGIERIDPTPGEVFDPHRHQAIFEVSDSPHPAGTVAQILQPGFAHHDRLLRPAMVGVAADNG